MGLRKRLILYHHLCCERIQLASTLRGDRPDLSGVTVISSLPRLDALLTPTDITRNARVNEPFACLSESLDTVSEFTNSTSSLIRVSLVWRWACIILALEYWLTAEPRPAPEATLVADKIGDSKALGVIGAGRLPGGSSSRKSSSPTLITSSASFSSSAESTPCEYTITGAASATGGAEGSGFAQLHPAAPSLLFITPIQQHNLGWFDILERWNISQHDAVYLVPCSSTKCRCFTQRNTLQSLSYELTLWPPVRCFVNLARSAADKVYCRYKQCWTVWC